MLFTAHFIDRSSFMARRLQRLVRSKTSILLVLTIDPNELYPTITTLHEGTDYRHLTTVARMRDSFETDEIASVQ